MPQDLENLQNDDLGEKLNAILSDPESLSRLAGMASALASSGVLSGLMGNGGGSGDAGQAAADTETAANQPTDSVPAEVSSGTEQKVSADRGNIKAVSGRHSALLRALKPYLGQEKQARIDQMMRLLQLAELADTVLRGK